MRTFLLLLAALAGCSEQPAPPVVASAEGTVLTGLYERPGSASAPDRMCIVEDDEAARFGLVGWGEGGRNCTAKGRVIREGSALDLRIDGDPACTLTAAATATGLLLAKPRGAECGYYCGVGGELSEGAFTRVATTAVEARKATDVVGEPLC